MFGITKCHIRLSNGGFTLVTDADETGKPIEFSCAYPVADEEILIDISVTGYGEELQVDLIGPSIFEHIELTDAPDKSSPDTDSARTGRAEYGDEYLLRPASNSGCDGC